MSRSTLMWQLGALASRGWRATDGRVAEAAGVQPGGVQSEADP